MAYNAETSTMLFVLLIGSPLILSLWMLRPIHDRISVAERLLLSISLYLTLFLAGQWVRVGLVNRYLTLAILLLSVTALIQKARIASWKERRSIHQMLSLSLNGGLSLLSVGLLFLTLQGRFVRGSAIPIDYQAPLPTGKYLVIEGGHNPLLNTHAFDRSLRNAAIITKIDALGFNSPTIYPTQNEDFYAFGVPVLSPCSGEILRAVGDKEELPLGAEQAGSDLGNLVLIKCTGSLVLLASLRNGSLRVSQGDTVESSAPLAEVGHTGVYPEPALVILTSSFDQENTQLSSVPFLLGAKTLTRNQVLSVP